MSLPSRWSRAAVALLAFGLVVGGSVGAANAEPRTPAVPVQPIIVTAPTEAPAYGTFPVKVAITPTALRNRRTAVLTASRDGVNWSPISSWHLHGSFAKVFTIQAGQAVGRAWLRVAVTGRGVKPKVKTVSVRITNPYRPAAPDNADLPEAGIVVDATLFGNHPIQGAPEGAGTVRLWDTNTTWNQIEKARGQYQWGTLDRAVSQAEANGQQVLLVLGGTPEWAATGNAPGNEFAGTGSSMPMTDPVLFEEYVRAVVGRYGGRIGAYQIWNEGNIPEFWRGTPQLLADLTARAYSIIKSMQPGATVVAASTGSRWIKGFTGFYPDYLTALGNLNWPIDAFSVHLYPTADGTTKDRTFLLGMMKTALHIANAPSKPIWETEINYGITNPGGGQSARSIPESEVPGYVARTYMDSLRFGIARSYWYGWTSTYRLLGIQMWTGYNSSRAYVALRNWVVGAHFSGCSSTGAVVQCNFDRAGVPFDIVYTDDTSTGSIPVPNGYTQATPLMGSAVPVSGTMQVTGLPTLLI